MLYMKPLYIFDLDGTLALIDHRRHLVADKKDQDWDAFYRACVDDKPNVPIINILNALIQEDEYQEESDNDVYIFSGRSDLVRTETELWLYKNTWYSDVAFEGGEHLLKMRAHGDNTPDEILKRRWYEELTQADKYRLVCVFDDRQKVVDMWRSIGVTCLQVADGKF